MDDLTLNASASAANQSPVLVLAGLLLLVVVVAAIWIARIRQHAAAQARSLLAAHESLRQSEAMFRQVLDAATDMIIVKNRGSRIVWANKAFRDCYGMTVEELNGIFDAEFVEMEYTLQYMADDRHVAATGQVLDIPCEPVVRHDGCVVYMHTVKSPIFGDDGQVFMTVGISRQIRVGQQDEGRAAS